MYMTKDVVKRVFDENGTKGYQGEMVDILKSIKVGPRHGEWGQNGYNRTEYKCRD